MPTRHQLIVGLGRHPTPERSVRSLADRLERCGAAVSPDVVTVDGDLLLTDPESRPDTLDALVALRGASVAAAMADALADLHDAGMMHGSVGVESFAVDADGRLRIRDAGLAAIVDGTDHNDREHHREETVKADVRALCRAAADLLAAPSPGMETEHNSVMAVLRHHVRRPRGARRLAADLAAAQSRGARGRAFGPRLPPPGVVVGGCAALGVVAAALAMLGSHRAPSATPSTHSTHSTHTAQQPEAPAVASTPAPRTTTTCPDQPLAADPGAAVVLADVLSPGCRQPIAILGSTVETLGPDGTAVRFAVGSDGDQVLLGHWGCSPVSLPATYRPSTGDVFLFGAWPWAQSPTTARQSSPAQSTGVVGGHAVVVPASGTCQHVEVRPG